MKKILLSQKLSPTFLLLLFLFASHVVKAQTNYYSSGNNPPNVLTNWWTNTNGTGSNPTNFTSANAIFNVQNGHTMTTTAAWTVSGTGSQIRILTGGTVVASQAITAPTITVAAGATYQHNQNGGSIPTATWNAASTLVVSGVVGTAPAATSFAQSFGNFTWNCPTQTTDFSLIGYLLTVNGNMTIAATNTGSLRLSNSGVDDDITIAGNFVQTGGEFYMSGSGNNTWDMFVGGNFTLSGGTFDMNGGSGTAILHVVGDYTHTGGTLTETGSSTTSMVEFEGAGTQNYTSGGTISNIINFRVDSPSTLQLGTGASPSVISGSTGTFTVSSGATLGVTSAAGIAATGATGNIQVTGTRAFATGANYIYNGTAAQVTGTGLSQNTPANLTLNNGAGVTLSAVTAISGNLLISQGTLSSSGSNFNLSVGGNWTNNGGFTAGTANQIFTGAGRTIDGTSATTFGGLVIATGASCTMNTSNTANSITFNAAATTSSLTHASGTTMTVNGAVTINQSSSNTAISSWNINEATATVSGLISFAGTGSTNTGRVQEIVITNGTLNANGGITFANVNNTARRIFMSGGSGNLNLRGTLTLAGQQTLTAGTNSTFTYLDSTAAQTVRFFSSGGYNNLRIDNTSTTGATLGAAVTASNVTGNLSVGSVNSGSTLNNAGFAMTLASTKNFSVGSGSTFNLTGTSAMVAVSGGGTKTFNATSTTNYGGSNQTVSGETYGNLTINGTGTKTAGGASTIVGNFTIGASTFAASTFTHNVAGNFTNNATFTQNTSTLNFNGTSAQVIGGSSPTTFNNLTIDTNPSTVTVTNSSFAFDVTGNLTVNDGNLTLQATDDNYTVTGNLTVGANGRLTHSVNWDTSNRQLNVNGSIAIDGAYGIGTASRAHVSMTGGGTFVHTGTSALNILTIATNGIVTADGTLTVNDNFWAPFNTTGTFVTGNNTVNANAALLVANGTLNVTGGTLNVNGGIIVGQAAAVGGTVNISGGTVNTDGITLGEATSTIASTITHTGGILNVNGAVTIHQPAANVTNNWNINASTVNVSGLITFAGNNTGTSRVSRIVITTGTLNANGGMTFVGSAAATKVIFMSGGAGNLNLRGALTVPAASSTLTAGTTSNFNYVDSAPQTINYFSAGAYNNLRIDNTNASGATLSAAITASNVTGNLSVGTVNSGSLFNNGGFSIALASARNLNVANGSTFNLSGTSTMASVSGGGTKTFGASSTTLYSGAGQTVTPETYGNLTLSGFGTKTFSTATSIVGNLNIATGIVANLATANHSAGTLTLGGFGTSSGSHGSSTSTATHVNNTFFAATTGTIGVGMPSCGVFNAAISGTATICEGLGTNLSIAITGGRAPYNVVYSGGTLNPYTSGSSISVSPGSSTTYTLTTVRDANGCTATNSGSAVVTVNPRPTASVLSGNAAICAGSTTNLQVAITSGTPPFNVVYSAGNVSSYSSGANIPVTPTTTTSYTLTSVTDANGCVGIGNSGSANVTIDATTSTNGGATWSNGAPAAGKSVIFDGSTATLGADFTACSLRLRNNATVNVTAGFDVTLTGGVFVESGSVFTLNNNANLLQTIPAGRSYANTGNIIVKRNSSALKRFDYTLWSSPVTGQGIYAFSKLTFGNRFYAYRTNTNVYNNPDLGFAITGTDANSVNGTDSNNVQFAQAKGYLIRMPWNHPTAPAIWNGSFTGVPNNGDVTFTMTNGGAGQQFNLVGNPYPSPISMTQFVADNSTRITGTLYFWRETNNNTSNNAYCSWAGGTFTSNNEAQVVNPNGIIQTGQGFFVEASGAATTVDFRNGQRSTDNSNQFFKNSNTTNDVEETNRFWLNLTSSTGAFSQMAAGYMTNATDGVDLYDGKNINTGSVLLNSILDNTDYVIQGKALPFNTSDVIPLSMKITTAGNYTIAIDHVDGIFSDSQAVYLKDNVTTVIHNLSAGAYNFVSDAGNFTNRFEVVYQSQPLGTPTFTLDSVVIYNQDNNFVVNSGNTVMKSIRVFDVRGRLLQEKTAINASQATIDGGSANQVLLLQITSEDGIVVTKKVIR